MFNKLRELFQPSPKVITVRPVVGGWTVEWRGGDYYNEPSSYDCETKDEALEFAHKRKRRLGGKYYVVSDIS